MLMNGWRRWRTLIGRMEVNGNLEDLTFSSAFRCDKTFDRP